MWPVGLGLLSLSRADVPCYTFSFPVPLTSPNRGGTAQVVVECSPTGTLSVRVTSLGLRSAIPMGEGTRCTVSEVKVALLLRKRGLVKLVSSTRRCHPLCSQQTLPVRPNQDQGVNHPELRQMTLLVCVQSISWFLNLSDGTV
ncbi:unnamed protein product [Arctogadus glacialis]